MKTLVLSLALVMSAIGCQKKYTQAEMDAANANGVPQARAVAAGNLVIQLQKEWGASGSVEVVKFGKDNSDFVVLKFQDSIGQHYIAVDIKSYMPGISWSTYSSTNAVYGNLTSNGDGTFSCSVGCVDYTGSTTPVTMVFEKTTASVKDLEKAAALAESYSVHTLATNMAAEFGLSDERALKVAKLAKSWEKLSKSRALTNADADAFAKEVSGVSIKEMQEAAQAMADGSLSKMDMVLEKAAEVNGTTSENMAIIMTKLFM